jgi:hypothetical protein
MLQGLLICKVGPIPSIFQNFVLSPNTIQGYRIITYCSVFVILLRAILLTIPGPEDVSNLV